MRSCLRLLDDGNSFIRVPTRTAKGHGAIHVSMQRPVTPLVAASCSLVLLAFLLLTQSVFAQSDQQSADCTFQDGKQLSIRYEPVKSDKLPQSGKVWMPGGSPLTLFSQATLDVGGSNLPPAAYSLYVIPGEEQWTLIVNKNVTAANKYDKAQDVVRLPMQTAKLGQPVDHMKVILGRMAPMQCNLRIYFGSVGAFGVEMKQK